MAGYVCLALDLHGLQAVVAVGIQVHSTIAVSLIPIPGIRLAMDTMYMTTLVTGSSTYARSAHSAPVLSMHGLPPVRAGTRPKGPTWTRPRFVLDPSSSYRYIHAYTSRAAKLETLHSIPSSHYDFNSLSTGPPSSDRDDPRTRQIYIDPSQILQTLPNSCSLTQQFALLLPFTTGLATDGTSKAKLDPQGGRASALRRPHRRGSAATSPLARAGQGRSRPLKQGLPPTMVEQPRRGQRQRALGRGGGREADRRRPEVRHQLDPGRPRGGIARLRSVLEPLEPRPRSQHQLL